MVNYIDKTRTRIPDFQDEVEIFGPQKRGQKRMSHRVKTERGRRIVLILCRFERNSSLYLKLKLCYKSQLISKKYADWLLDKRETNRIKTATIPSCGWGPPPTSFLPTNEIRVLCACLWSRLFNVGM